MREEIFHHIKKKYKVSSEYPWGSMKTMRSSAMPTIKNGLPWCWKWGGISWGFREMSVWT